MEDGAEFFLKAAAAVGWVPGAGGLRTGGLLEAAEEGCTVSTWPDPTWGWGNSGAGVLLPSGRPESP